MTDLKGRKALVTGGTAGIGRAIALKLVQEGADVAIFGTNAERAQSVLKELEAARPSSEQTVRTLLVDVSDFAAVDEAVKELHKEWDALDILVNNAGITKDKLFIAMKEEDWDRVIDVNLKSVYNLTKAALRPMLKKRSGAIINITSVIGLKGNPGQTNYAASKAGMIGFTRSLAREVAPKGVTVNCIAPGFIESSMTDKLNEAQKEAILSQVPMKRLGTPEDIANAAHFLASRHGSYITGQVLTVDGGMLS